MLILFWFGCGLLVNFVWVVFIEMIIEIIIVSKFVININFFIFFMCIFNVFMIWKWYFLFIEIEIVIGLVVVRVWSVYKMKVI